MTLVWRASGTPSGGGVRLSPLSHGTMPAAFMKARSGACTWLTSAKPKKAAARGRRALASRTRAGFYCQLLAPDIVEAILSGRTHQALMLERLERQLPMPPPRWRVDQGWASCISEA